MTETGIENIGNYFTPLLRILNLTRIAGILDSEPSEKVMACATEDWNMEGPTSPTTRDRASTVP